MQQARVCMAHDVRVEIWGAARRHITCVSRHGPTLRMALLGASGTTPPDALEAVAMMLRAPSGLDAALQAANLRTAHRAGDVPRICVAVIEVAPTYVRLVRIGPGEAWLHAGSRWTPALAPLAPGAWASPPLGMTWPLQGESCRIPRGRVMRAAIATTGASLGDMRLDHLGQWLDDAHGAPAASPEGPMVAVAHIGAAGLTTRRQPPNS